MDLKELIEVSRFYGRGNDFVIAGGGNTSVKDDHSLVIKASGAALRDITEQGFVELSRSAVRAIMTRAYSDDPFKRESAIKADLLASRTAPERGGRPSVETSLHEMIGFRFVVHTHPCVVNSLTCAARGEQTCRELFGDAALWVPYTDPGYRLAQLVEKTLAAYRDAHAGDPHLVFMQNHGLVVAADTVAEIHSLTDDVVRKITARFDASLPHEEKPVADIVTRIVPALRMMLSDENGVKIAAVRNNSLVEHFLEPENRKAVALPFMPDNIVYCKSAPLFLDNAEDTDALLESFPGALAAYRKTWGYAPKILLVPGLGVVAVEDTKRSADTCLDVFEDLMKVSFHAESFGGPRFLSPDNIHFIDTWEVENYRRSINKGTTAHRRVEGRVGIVTGAAQGFGKGIAEGLFSEGANIVIADLNAEAGRALERDLNAAAGTNRALFVSADVTSPVSLQGLARECVKAFGGADLLISNAGVLKAGSLEEMTPESFEFVTRVNYNGYFLCVKQLSPVMKLQRHYRPGWMADIIQINSKSGLEGSNKNFAYAGGKFGGIGLTQSFALELVEFGIKVNAICPGNFFEGPLWADPEKGLFVQYLRAGKVPGAKTVDEVRRFYESKVPMGRGCRVADVLKAILYIMDQEYETGQAVPVTGGQVMLA